MQRLQPDRASPGTVRASRRGCAGRSNAIIGNCWIDHPETVRVFQKLLCVAQEQLERVDGEAER
jgi:hypothetical protein